MNDPNAIAKIWERALIIRIIVKRKVYRNLIKVLFLQLVLVLYNRTRVDKTCSILQRILRDISWSLVSTLFMDLLSLSLIIVSTLITSLQFFFTVNNLRLIVLTSLIYQRFSVILIFIFQRLCMIQSKIFSFLLMDVLSMTVEIAFISK